jgi:hypothetical protein
LKRFNESDTKVKALLAAKLELEEKNKQLMNWVSEPTHAITTANVHAQTEDDERLVDLKEKLSEVELMNRRLASKKSELEQILVQYEEQVNQLKMRMNLADKQLAEANVKSSEWAAKLEKAEEHKHLQAKDFNQKLKEKQHEIENLRVEIKHSNSCSEQDSNRRVQPHQEQSHHLRHRANH